MILQALYELAQSENLVPDRDFEVKPVAWCVRVAKDGDLVNIEPLKKAEVVAEGSKRKPRMLPKPMRVPYQGSRTSGDRAFFLVDKAEYSLAWDPDGERDQGKLKTRFRLFRETVEECSRATSDPGVGAVSRFLKRIDDGDVSIAMPSGCKTNDLFCFAYGLEESPVHEREKVRAYWKESRQAQATTAGNETITCLVTGKRGAPARKLPPVKRVPGGSTSGVALVSFNASAFESYGWKEGADLPIQNAPVSEEAAVATMTALNRLLDPNPPKPSDPDEKLPRRNIHLSADTVVCYWARKDCDSIVDMLAIAIEVDENKAKADPNLLRAMYDGIWKGKPYVVGAPDAFYSLVLSGGQGRATLRDWIETNTQHVVNSLAQYFADLAIVRRTPPTKALGRHPPGFPLPLLLEAIADPCERRSEGVPASVAATMYRTAIDARVRFPQIAFTRAIARYRSEVGQETKEGTDGWRAKNWNDARAAIIKAYLNRNKGKEIRIAMNPKCTESGYLLGQLMAVLERLQNLALDDVNAGVVDRYFSGASAAPKSVFFNLLKNARHHARKAKDGTHAGMVFRLERLIDHLCDQFVVRDGGGKLRLDRVEHNGFPASLDQEQQGLFVIGYHQMRKWLSLYDERAEWEAANQDAPRCYLWTKTT